MTDNKKFLRADPLLTDQYTLTMAQSFWLNNIHEEITVFELFVRKLPAHRNYLVAAGLESVLDYLESFSFEQEDIDFLDSLGLYKKDFLEYLKTLRFTGQIKAVPEGTVLPAQAPLLAVKATRIQAAIIESILLSIINHQTMIASKAARIVSAAQGKEIWDFSLRRLHGPDAALGVARAAYIAGAVGTATVAAGREMNIPTAGTMAHHYVQSFGPENEQEAFEHFLRDYPENNTLLIDTYDTLEGVKKAMNASVNTGVALQGVRLDSGDLNILSKAVRALLDNQGFENTKIFASNDLDEYKIANLLKNKAPIDSFGVGTMLGTSADAPYLGGVFKIVAQEASSDFKCQRPDNLMKLAPGKQTDPGEHQLWRDNKSMKTTLSLADETLAGEADSRALLTTAMSEGKRIKESPSLREIKDYCKEELDSLPDDVRRIDLDTPLLLNRSDKLIKLKEELANN